MHLQFGNAGFRFPWDARLRLWGPKLQWLGLRICICGVVQPKLNTENGISGYLTILRNVMQWNRKAMEISVQEYKSS